jgi:hypothetical protein
LLLSILWLADGVLLADSGNHCFVICLDIKQNGDNTPLLASHCMSHRSYRQILQMSAPLYMHDVLVPPWASAPWGTSVLSSY